MYPDLELPEQEELVIGRFGQKHKRFLKKVSKLTYLRLLISGKLKGYLVDVDCQAQELFDAIVNQSIEVYCVALQLKVENLIERARQMMNINMNMEENFVLQKLIYILVGRRFIRASSL